MLFGKFFSKNINGREPQVYNFLDKLEASDVILMYDAAPYIQLQFTVNKRSAELLLRLWLERKHTSTVEKVPEKKTPVEKVPRGFVTTIIQGDATCPKKIKDTRHCKEKEIIKLKRPYVYKTWVVRKNPVFPCSYYCSNIPNYTAYQLCDHFLTYAEEVKYFTVKNNVKATHLAAIKHRLGKITHQMLRENAQCFRTILQGKITYIICFRDRKIVFKQGDHI